MLNLGGPGPDPRHSQERRVVRVRRSPGGRFMRWAVVILLVLAALAVIALWQGAASLQHVAQSSQAMSRTMSQGTAGLDRYLQRIGLALQGIGRALGQLLHALRP